MSGEPMTTAQLIREADDRLTVGRLGKSMARETDLDLLAIRRLRNALMVLSTRQGGGDVEVRSLPDRETIARKLDPAAWDPASRFTVAERAIRQETSLGKADAVLALFGKEGQATDEMSPRDLDHWRKGHDVGYAHGTTDAQLQAYEERQR